MPFNRETLIANLKDQVRSHILDYLNEIAPRLSKDEKIEIALHAINEIDERLKNRSFGLPKKEATQDDSDLDTDSVLNDALYEEEDDGHKGTEWDRAWHGKGWKDELRNAVAQEKNGHVLLMPWSDTHPKLKLSRKDSLAFDYAMAMAGLPGNTNNPNEFRTTINALENAPDFGGLSYNAQQSVDSIINPYYSLGYGQEEEISERARNLAGEIRGRLSFGI